MHKELLSIKLIANYMEKKGLLNEKVNNIHDIYSFFQYITSPPNNKKFNSLYILNYIHQYIVSENVAKRKTSARVFEDLLAIIFKGEVTDNQIRKNIIKDVPDYFSLIKDKIAGNRREKIDLLFDNYGMSVKTLMKNNTEINLGSFEKNVLFDNFEVEKYLTERTNKEAIGLGSKPQLRQLLNLIEKNGHYNKFKERFIKMYSYIFNDDMIILVKNNLKAELYFFSGLDFTNFMNSKIDQIDSFLDILNRWEGNSIRIDRTKLLKECNKKIELDFSIFEDTVIETINNFDCQLHRVYVEYFNEPYNLKFKKDLTDTLDDMFYKFDNWLKLIK